MADFDKGLTEHKPLDSQISIEQIRLLYGSLKFSLGASFVVGAIMYFTLIDHSDSNENLRIWLYFFLFVFTARTLDGWMNTNR